MNQRGIKNQSIPNSHEISIESYRLLALAYSIRGETELAIQQHQLFLEAVTTVQDLFDPIALATSLTEYGKDLAKLGRYEDSCEKLTLAYEHAKYSLGVDHFFTRGILSELDGIRHVKIGSNRKRRKIEHTAS